MGQDKGVNSLNLFLPEKRGDHIFSDIKTVLMEAPSVYQHPLPLWEFDQNGVSMAHIDEGEGEVFAKAVLQVPVGQIGGKKDADSDKEIFDLFPFPEMHP